jgi:hypothetical protein
MMGRGGAADTINSCPPSCFLHNFLLIYMALGDELPPGRFLTEEDIPAMKALASSKALSWLFFWGNLWS